MTIKKKINIIDRVTKSIKVGKLSLGVGVLFAIAIGAELFNVINSLRLNLFMPTLSRVLHEDTVRSWVISSGDICIRYGNVLWDALCTVVFLLVAYGLWRLIDVIVRRKA